MMNSIRNGGRALIGVEGPEGKLLLSGLNQVTGSSVPTTPIVTPPPVKSDWVTPAHTGAEIEMVVGDHPMFKIRRDVRVVLDASGGYDVVLRGSSGSISDHLDLKAGEVDFDVHYDGGEADFAFDKGVRTVTGVSPPSTPPEPTVRSVPDGPSDHAPDFGKPAAIV